RGWRSSTTGASPRWWHPTRRPLRWRPALAERVRISTVAAAFLRRSWLEQTVRWSPVVLQLGGFALGILSQAYLGRLVDAAPNPPLSEYAGHYAAFLLLGVAVLDLQGSTVTGLGESIREAQLSGSLEALLATPAPTALMLFALALPDVLWAAVRL